MKIMYLTLAGINLGLRGKPLGVTRCACRRAIKRPTRDMYCDINTQQGCRSSIYSSVITCKGVVLLIIDILVIQ